MPAVNNASPYGKTTAGEWKPWDTVYVKRNGVWVFGMVVWVKRPNPTTGDSEWHQVFVRLTSATNLSAVVTQGSQTVTLNWTPGLGADGFRIYNGNTLIKTVTGGTTNTTTVDLEYYISHVITVRAYSGNIEAAPSNSVTIYNSITAPTSLTVTGGSGTRAVSLSWTAGSGQTGYKIYRDDVEVATITSGTTASYTLPDYYTTYNMSVRGYYTSSSNITTVSGASSKSISATLAAPTITSRSVEGWSYSYVATSAYGVIIDEWLGNVPMQRFTWNAVDGASSYVFSSSTGASGSTGETSFGYGDSRQNYDITWYIRARHSSGNLGPVSAVSFRIGQPQVRSFGEVVKFHDTSNRNTLDNRAVRTNSVLVGLPWGAKVQDFRAELWASFETTSVDNGTNKLCYIVRPTEYGGTNRIIDFTNEFSGGGKNPYDVTIIPALTASNEYGYKLGNWGVSVAGSAYSEFTSGFYYLGKQTDNSRGRLFIRLRYRFVSQDEIGNSVL